MIPVRYDLPAFNQAEAEQIAWEWFGIRGQARPLPSERDQNFRLGAGGGQAFVLKIANHTEAEAVLDLQNAALDHLATRAPSLALPRVGRTRAGEPMVRVPVANGREHFVRLLSWVPGQVWASTRPRGPALLRSLGSVLAQLDAALADFRHPAATRPLKWDLARAGWVRDYLGYLPAGEQRDTVAGWLERFEREALPRLPSLRHSVIYNDANEHNVLVSGPEADAAARHVLGVIDFGDMVHSATVGNLAVAAAYALQGQADLVAALAELVAGYHAAFPLEPAELEVLLPLVGARLCTTVANAAFQREALPGNDYLQVSEAAAWDVLRRLGDAHPRLAHYRLRAACGLPAHPQAAAAARWLAEQAPGPVVNPPDAGAEARAWDLSMGSPVAGQPVDWTNGTLARRLAEESQHGPGLGRYGEARPWLALRQPAAPGLEGPERASLHLGLDLAAPAGTPVLAPLDGAVTHVAKGAVALAHPLPGGGTIYSIYRHLAPEADLGPGAEVARGRRLGAIAPAAPGAASPLPAHLHLQLALDLLDSALDFPTSARPSEWATFAGLAPNPAPLLAGTPKLNAALAKAEAASPAELTAQAGALSADRRQRLGHNLSLSYRRPLPIVRGYGAYLYDHLGQAYLDTVNNVTHVGHSHPRVVAAAAGQLAVLTTNTRYLHPAILQYAERLTALLPAPLRVCYFVNSGSEANELALRLARAYTGRTGLIVVDAAYHGNTAGLIDISPYKHAGPGGRGAPPHVRVLPMPDVYRGACRDPEAAGPEFGRHAARATAELQAQGLGVAAFIAESILSCGGQIVLPAGALAAAYAPVRAAGGVCIADEVQVGFGRVGSHFWAFETQGVVPDIVTLGKPIGNGFPLGAVITTPAIAAAFDNGMEYFNTFGGSPAAAAVGLAVLDVLADEGLPAHAARIGEHLLQGLGALAERHPAIGDVRGLGLFIGIELVSDRAARTPAGEIASYVAERMRDLGVLMSTDGPQHNVLKIKPPLVFAEREAEQLLTTLDTVLGEDFVTGR